MARLIDLPEMIVRDVAALRPSSRRSMVVTSDELDRIVTSRVAEVADEIERLRADRETYNIWATEIKAENERLRRLLWLIIKSNGGYTLERHDIEQWPGADRGEVVTMEDPTTGNFVFSAITNGQSFGEG